MNLLAVDTSGPVAGVAVLDPGGRWHRFTAMERGGWSSMCRMEYIDTWRETERFEVVDGNFAYLLPHAPDAWVAREATKIGYEISFARYFYKPAPLRSLEEIRADILALERQTEGLLSKIVGGA